MRRGRDLLGGVLEQLDIPFVFGTTGSLDTGPGAQLVQAPHEDMAVGMATGFARGSGKVGVVWVDGEPGLARGLGNVYAAGRARAPLVIAAVQEPTLADRVWPFTKSAYHVRSTAELGIGLQRAFRDAVAPPVGAVGVSIPTDVLDEATDADPPRISHIGSGTRGDEAELARGAAALAGAESPVILAGDGVGLDDAWPELITLAERLGAPVFTEPQSTIWNFPNRHAHWQGEALDMSAVVEHADVVLVCGVSSLPAISQAHVKIVEVSDNPWELASNQAVAAGILGDVKLNLTALVSALRATSQARSVVGAGNRRRAALEQHASDRRARWEQATEPRRLTATAVASDLALLLPRDAILCDELGPVHRQPFINLLEFSSPLSYSSLSASAAIGLHLARPEQPVISAMNARAFLRYPQVLSTAASVATGSIVFLVIDSGAEGVASLATALGVDAERVVEVSELRAALERGLSAGRPYLLDITLDPST